MIEYKIDSFGYGDRVLGVRYLDYLNERGAEGWVLISTKADRRDIVGYWEEHLFYRHKNETSPA